MKKYCRAFVALLVCLTHLVQAQAAVTRSTTVVMVPLTTSSGVSRYLAELSQIVSQKLAREFNLISSQTMGQLLKTTARSPKAITSVYELVKKGREAFAVHGSTTRALDYLNEAKVQLLKAEPSLNTSELMLTIELTRAWIYFRGRGQPKSRAILEDLVRAYPQEALNVKGFPHDFRGFVARFEKPTLNTYEIKFNTRPTAVDVFVNGLFVGTSSKSIQLPAGEYDVAFVATGRQTQFQHVSVQGDAKFNASLPWIKDESTGLAQGIRPAYSPQELMSIAAQAAGEAYAAKSVVWDIKREGQGYRVLAKVFDHKYSQPMRTITSFKVHNLAKDTPQLAQYFAERLPAYLSGSERMYRKNFEREFILDQRLASRPARPLHQRPAFWATVGGVVVGGVILGLVASGSQSNSSGSGNIALDFSGL